MGHSGIRYHYAVDFVLQSIHVLDSTQFNQPRPLNFMKIKKFGKLLGKGCFGDVHIVDVLVEGYSVCHSYAAKRFCREIQCQDPQKYNRKFLTEYTLLHNLQHENIVCYVGVSYHFDSDMMPLLIMELMKTSLFKRLYPMEPEGLEATDLTLSKKLCILHDVAKGLHYLHSRNPLVIHRDLTAHNALLDDDDRAKIADFGNAKMITSQQCQQELQTAYPGARAYSAPEVSTGVRKYDEKCDIFSFAHLILCTLSQMCHELTCARDEDHNGELKAYTEVQRRQKYFDTLYEYSELTEILMIKQCLAFVPAKRPAACELVDILASIIGDPTICPDLPNTCGLRVVVPQPLDQLSEGSADSTIN